MAAPFDFSQTSLLNSRRYYLDDSYSARPHASDGNALTKTLKKLDFESNASINLITPLIQKPINRRFTQSILSH